MKDDIKTILRLKRRASEGSNIFEGGDNDGLTVEINNRGGRNTKLTPINTKGSE